MSNSLESVIAALHKALEAAIDQFPQEAQHNLLVTIAQLDPVSLSTDYLIGLLQDEELLSDNPELRNAIIGRVRSTEMERRIGLMVRMRQCAGALYTEVFGEKEDKHEC